MLTIFPDVFLFFLINCN